MVQSGQINPGMTVTISGKLYRVESITRVAAKGSPFIKMKLRDLVTQASVEKNFKPTQAIEEVHLQERRLEYLYMEKNDYLFMDVANLDQVLVSEAVIGTQINYLKEGTEVKASCYGSKIFAIELPQFLELMVTEQVEEKAASKTTSKSVNKSVAAKVGTNLSNTSNETKFSQSAQTTSKVVELETGAKVEVPAFIAVGDIIKIDSKTKEYIQRV